MPARVFWDIGGLTQGPRAGSARLVARRVVPRWIASGFSLYGFIGIICVGFTVLEGVAHVLLSFLAGEGRVPGQVERMVPKVGGLSEKKCKKM